MMKPGVFIVYSNLSPGGIPTKIIDIAQLIVRSDTSMHVHIFLRRGSINDRRSQLRSPRIRIHTLHPILGRISALMFIPWIWSWILLIRPQSILTFISPYALPILAAKFLFRLLTFTVVVSEDHFTETMTTTMLFPKIQQSGIRTLYRTADTIITPTAAVRSQLIRMGSVPNSSIKVVPNWTRLSHIQIPPGQRRWDVIFFGRLVASKNPLRAVALFNQLRFRLPTIRCLIVGEGPESTRLSQAISSYHLQSTVTTMPFTDRIDRFLLSSKAGVFLPERQIEGFPIAMLEAMACGAIVISLPFDGAREVIRSGINGYICSSDTNMLEILAGVIKGGDGIAKIRRSALDTVRKNHTLENARTYITCMKIMNPPRFRYE